MSVSTKIEFNLERYEDIITINCCELVHFLKKLLIMGHRITLFQAFLRVLFDLEDVSSLILVR